LFLEQFILDKDNDLLLRKCRQWCEHSGRVLIVIFRINSWLNCTLIISPSKHDKFMFFQAHRQTTLLAKRLVTKTLLVMKITSFLLLAAVLQVSARGFSQEKITITAKGATLESVLKDIRRQTGYQYLFADQLAEGVHPIDISVRNASLDQVLDSCFSGQPYTYEIIQRMIVVKRKAERALADVPTPPAIVKAQGVVYNESGQPLSGANVTDKKTGRATITNVRGEFQFSNVEVNGTLTITFVGYAPQEVKIKDATSMVIYMQPAKNELDKVVVQAYGTTTQRLATGNISTVSAAEIERHPVANVLTALQGNVPGMVVHQTNGYASAPFKVEIRGRTQIDPNRPSEPLYIIDGVPLTVLESGKGGSYEGGSSGFIQNGLNGPAGGQSPFFSINPNDIESISVLKDADATAIYGSRGANGVILITTKSGKVGKAALDIHVYQGESRVTQHYSMLNTQQYLQMRHEAFKNDSIIPNPGNAYDLLTWDTTRYTDMQKYLWEGVGRTTDAQVALSGGDKQNSFRIGGGYHRETDITAASGANQRASVQSSITHKSIDQRLNISFKTTYSFAQANMITLPSYITMPPDMPALLTPTGKLNWSGWKPQGNPGSSLFQSYTAKTGFLNSQLQLQYALWKGLSISTKLGYSTVHLSQTFQAPISSKDPARNPTGSSDFGNDNHSNAIIEPELQYKTEIGKGELNAIVGGSFQSASEDGNHISGSGYINDNLLGSISNAPIRSASDGNGQYKYAAVYVRVNYNLSGKYLLNLSARRDGSSRFGPGRQFGNFGAVGAAWIFSEEKWVKNHLPFLSFGKLRGSYGITGSDEIGNYGFLSAWTTIYNTYYQNIPSYQTTRLFNPNLQWQVNKKLEGALDLGFWKDRILFEVAWYRNRTSNQLVSAPLPNQTGFNQVTENLPATIQNTGIESTIKVGIIDGSTFHWTVNFNIGVNRNKLVAFPNLAQSQYAGNYIIGQPLSIAQLLHSTGIDPATGQYTFTDKNHDGRINRNPNDTANDLFPKDLQVRFDGGFGTDISYKGLDLNLFFRFRQQQLPSIYKSMQTPGTPGNIPAEVMSNHWQKPGDKARFARYTTRGAVSDANFYNYSDGGYCDGSFIRLQNVSLSYDLPGNLTRSIRLKSCRIFVHAENLFVITKYQGLDPDSQRFGQMPPAKTYVGGIQINL
jgi:TonB-linked SusC/RagA family outer membrane protein